MNSLCVVLILFGHLIRSVHFAASEEMRASTDSMKMQLAVSQYDSPAKISPRSNHPIQAPSHLSEEETDPPEHSYPLKERDAPFSLSSLSLGSSLQPNETLPAPDRTTRRTKNVSWGSVHFSESDEEEIPGALESERVPRLNRLRRFSQEPQNDTPARPPKRPSFTSEDLKDEVSDHLGYDDTSDRPPKGPLEALKDDVSNHLDDDR